MLRRVLSVVSVAVVASIFTLGCSNPVSSNSPFSFFKHTGTLQGKVMNAVTGAAIGGSDLKLVLIKGASTTSPTTLITDTTNVLCGEYSFTDIPVSTVSASDATFKVVVSKPGFQPFSANITMFSQTYIDTPSIWDDVINKIGNIYLFPIGQTSGDLIVVVKNPVGSTVPGATVLLQQIVTSNTTYADDGDRLNPTAGLYPSLTATSDANGKATFSGANLVLGGAYSILVEPIVYQGLQLQTKTSAAPIIIGTAATTQVASMTAATTTLYALSASNGIPGTITSTGVLTIVFNQPISLSTLNFNAALSAGSGGVVNATATGSLTADGLTLTITPVVTTAPTVAGATVTYTYAGTVTLKTSQSTYAPGIFGVTNLTNGSTVSGTVQMLAN